MHYLIIAEAGKKKKYAIKQSLITVGRGPDNPVRLIDSSVSEKHCQIERVHEGFRISDLKSELGVLVNGKKVASAMIRENDVIQIGNVKMAIMEQKTDKAKSRVSDGSSRPIGSTSEASNAKSGEMHDRKKEGDTLNIKEEFRAASEQTKNRLVRRKLRQGSSIPGWAQAVMAVWVVIAIVGVVLVVVKQAKPSPYQDQFLKAKNLERDSNAEAAIAAFEKIPLDDPQYGEQAAQESMRLKEEIRLREIQTEGKNAISWFENNIMLFINKYIDAPEGDEAMAKIIARDYARHRKAYVRVLILHRLSYYLEHFKGQRDYDEVTRLVEKYAEEYDPRAQVYYEDAEIESNMWLNLHSYGNAQQVLLDWKKNQTKKIADSDLNRLEKTLEGIETILISEWAMRDEYVKQMEAKGNYKEANQIYHRFLKRCEGYDTPTSKQFVEHWQKKFDENEILIHEQAEKIKEVF
ncbi:MAG: FHA domain-containing protein [Planctomycetota bacterium]